MYRETSKKSFLSKIIGSFVGALFGIAIFIGSFFVIFLNEGRQDLSEIAENSIIVGDTIASENDGKLISVTLPSKVEKNISDGIFLIDGEYIVLERNTEIYSWSEDKKTTKKDDLGGGETTVTTYSYKLEWNDTAPNSNNFKEKEGHENPTQEFTDRSITNTEIILGERKLSTKDLKIGSLERLKISEDIIKKKEVPLTAGELVREKILAQRENREVKSTKQSDELQYQVVGDYIFIGSGSLSSPEIGDERISFSAMKTGVDATVFGMQEGNEIIPYEYKEGKNLFAIFNKGHEESIEQLHGEYLTLLWIIRGVGFMMMAMGLAMFFGPISAILSVLPIAGKVSRKLFSAICFGVALVLTPITIIIARVFYNPVLLVIVIVILAGALYLYFHKKGNKTNNIVQENYKKDEFKTLENNEEKDTGGETRPESGDMILDISEKKEANASTAGSKESEIKKDDEFSFTVQ